MRPWLRAPITLLLASSLGPEVTAETVPLADLIVDARVETSAPIELDFAALGPRTSGLDFESNAGRAWGTGPESRLELRPAPRRGVVELTGRPFVHHGSRVQTVDLAIDDDVFRTLRLAPWERTYRVRVPDRLLREPGAMLSLRYRWSAKPSEVLADSDDTRDLTVSWSALRIETLGASIPTTLGREGDEVVVRGGDRIRIPLRTTLPATLHAVEIEAKATAGLRVRLDASETAAVEGIWTERAVEELATTRAPTGQHLRLTLQTVERDWWRRLLALGRPAEVRIRGGAVNAAKISWPSRDLARMGFFPQLEGGVATPPKLVVLWIVDTLRADHLGVYGYERDTSPRLDAFAEDAVTFDRATAQSAWTRPSVTSILTGQVLKRHGVYDKDDALAREAVTLAETLFEAGYDTAAFITNGNLRHVGLEQGFRTFRHLKEGGAPPLPFHRPASEVAQAGLQWLEEQARLPAFLYLHVTDPHMPYEPTAAFAGLWPVADSSLSTIEGYRATINSPEPATQDLIDLYDAEIRQADAAFGALLDELERHGLDGDALIVFTADHGEEFLDHDGWQHGKSLYPEQIAVPLVVRWPPAASPFPPGSRVDSVAAHIDLAPTILRTVGVVPPTTMQGRDLAGTDSRPTLAELRHSRRASVDERYKLVTNPEGDLLGLYDSVEDPQERVDLTFSAPAVLEYHRRLHALFLERSAGGPDAAPAEQDEETLEQLRALGYIE